MEPDTNKDVYPGVALFLQAIVSLSVGPTCADADELAACCSCFSLFAFPIMSCMRMGKNFHRILVLDFLMLMRCMGPYNPITYKERELNSHSRHCACNVEFVFSTD